MTYGMTSSSKQIVMPVLLALVVWATAGSAVAQIGRDDDQATFTSQHQVGVRLGVWSNSGATPPDRLIDTTNSIEVTTDINSASFFLEGFFGYRFTSWLMGEFSFGLSNRGDVVTRDTQLGINDVAALNIYPILLQAKFYAPPLLGGKLHPFVSAGGGIYYARNSIQVTDEFFFAQFREDSETDFNYVLGGGFDWPLASQVGLDFNVKYMPIEFSEELVGITDYKALTVTVGVKYLYTPKKQ
ncbi:outer membrane beta-barrel protein [candidate division GN15 bacterium]|nr:outer membrane beta-barrel protein [candidate division GN15 bacterium]